MYVLIYFKLNETFLPIFEIMKMTFLIPLV